MTTVIDPLFLRRPPLRYVSPPVCPVIVSASGSMFPMEDLFPVASPGGVFVCGVTGLYISRTENTSGALCYSVYQKTGTTAEIRYQCIATRTVTLCRTGCYKVSVYGGSPGNPYCVTGDVPVTIPLPEGTSWTLYRNPDINNLDGSYAIEAHFSTDLYEVCAEGDYAITAITLDGESPLSAVITVDADTCGGGGGPITPPVDATCHFNTNVFESFDACYPLLDANHTDIPIDEDGFYVENGIAYLIGNFTSDISQFDADDKGASLFGVKVQEFLDLNLLDCQPPVCDVQIDVGDVGEWPYSQQIRSGLFDQITHGDLVDGGPVSIHLQSGTEHFQGIPCGEAGAFATYGPVVLCNNSEESYVLSVTFVMDGVWIWDPARPPGSGCLTYSTALVKITSSSSAGNQEDKWCYNDCLVPTLSQQADPNVPFEHTEVLTLTIHPGVNTVTIFLEAVEAVLNANITVSPLHP